MSGPARDGRGNDSGDCGRIAEAVREFESALQRMLDGGPPPSIDPIVAAADEADRDLLRQNLLKSEYQWRNRAAQATIDPTASVIKAGDTNSGAPEATIELSAGQSDSSTNRSNGHAAGETADGASPQQLAVAATLPPSNPAPAAGSDATIDLPGGANHAPSMSPAQRAAAATGFWDPHAPAKPQSQELGFTIDAVAGAVRAKAESSRPTVPGYELLSELGRGGMGVVYKAVQTKLHRVVALKMVLAGAHASPDQLARFATEAEAVAALQHPNIVQIYEVGEQNGLPFFSLEFVDGQPLDKRLAGKPQAPRVAAKLMEPIARAMHVAHERGIVHRDLKPANVLLTRDSVPKVTDFGLAKKLESDSSQTKEGTLMGTPSYMAPEQARGEVHLAGPAADIHSLGAMLYEMLVGRPPYLGATPLETMMQVTSTEPVPPRKLMPKLSRDIETICLKCLQKEPARRYASAGELADDLARFQKGEPIHARPISKPERAWRWCRRNPRIAGLAAAVVVLVAAAGTATGKLAIDASREQQASEETRKLAEQRLEQANKAISTGDHRRAADLLRGRDVRLSTAPELADVRDEWQVLQSQVELYGDFQRLLAEAHFKALSGDRDDQLKGRETLLELLTLDREIRDHNGRAAVGLPPLNDEQQRLFKEGQFEALLLAAFTEYNLYGESADVKERNEALRRAIGWLDEAERILPDTRALYIQRASLRGVVGEEAAAKADMERAGKIKPSSAVDHFWHGLAEFMRAGGDRAEGRIKEAVDHYRRAISEYSNVLRINPRDFWGYTQWAACHLELDDLADAVIGTTAAIEIDPEHAMSYVNRAIAQMRLGNADDALQDLGAALAIDRACAPAYFNRALIHFHRQQDDSGLSDLARAIEAKANFEDAWLKRAETLHRLKRDDEALADFQHLIEIARRPAPARLRRAELLRELGRREDALADLDAVVETSGNNLEALRKRWALRAELNRPEEALSDLDALLRVNADDTEALSSRAELRRKLKRNDDALADYSRLIELGHEDALNRRRRADLYRDLGRADEAIAEYGEVVKRKPNDADAWFQRAALEFNTGRHAAARDDAGKVIELAPQAPQPYQMRAMINLVTFKEIDASLADWRRLAELTPKNAMAHYFVGALEMGRRNYVEAIAGFDRAIELVPDYVDAHWGRAQTCLFQKRYEEALTELNLLIDKLATNRPAAVNSRGDVYRAMGRLDEAVADYRAFFERMPAPPDGEYQQAAVNACVNLAGVLDVQGKGEEARACYDELVANQPNSATALLERASDRRNHGQYDDALADCDAAAKIDPKSMLPGLARAAIIASRGDHAAAVAEAETLLAAAPANDGHVLWAAARVWSLASAAVKGDTVNSDAVNSDAVNSDAVNSDAVDSDAANADAGQLDARRLSQSYADRAADLLAQVVSRGFHDLLYPEHNRLPLDPALAPVRHHPRVEELFGE